MSMILGMTTIGDVNASRVLADPILVWRVIAPDEPEAAQNARRPAPVASFFGRLFGRGPAPGSTETPSNDPFVLTEGEGLSTDLDKAWHGIHYLLTGTAWEGSMPLNFLVSGGRQVGDIDVGYGPARVLSAAETRAAQQAMALVTEDDLRARFDPADMTRKEIYPEEIWARPQEEDDAFGYLLEYIRVLKGFLAQAVEQNQGVLIHLR